MPVDLKDMRREAAELLAAADAIVQAAQEAGRDITDAEQAEIDRYISQAETLQTHCADTVRAQNLTENKGKIAAIRDGFNAMPAVQDTIRPKPGATGMKHLWEDDPKKGFKSHRDFFRDVLLVSTGQKRESPQLQYLRSIRAAAGADEQSTFSDPYGGYLLPVAFAPQLLQVAPEEDPTQGLITPVPMDVATVHIAARVDKDHSTSVSGGLRVYRRAEADTVATSRMQFDRITLHAEALMGVSFATEELLTDSPMSFIALLQAGFGDEFNSRILTERLNGTGVGEFLGVMKSPALISVARTGAGAIDYLDILNMMARCWGYRNAVWMANHDCIPQLGQMNLQVGAGGSAIFVQNASLAMPSSLMGRPLVFSEYMQTLGALGDIILVNWTQYLEGTYQPLQSAESIHVRFVNAERAFRFMLRNDGAPWWRSALTPKNSTNTLSPYVALAA